MSKDLFIEVQSIGTSDLDTLCQELCDLADRMGIMITCEDRGRTAYVRPNDDPIRLAKKWADMESHQYMVKTKMVSLHGGGFRVVGKE